MSDERRLDRLTPDRELFGNFARRMVATLDERDFLRAQVDHLCAELTTLRESVRWIPVGERLPMDLLPRIVVDESGYVFPSCVALPYGAGKWMDFDGESVTTRITHWMDLPAPPEPQTVVEKTGRECPSCDNDEVFSDGDEQFEGELHRCEQCGKLAAISVTAGRYTLVDAPEPQAEQEVAR